ncbi:MAG: class I SAM-dependent methyltransferase [Candidatus Aenigmarchaeota archaeon]|nr:class I SAM-dependent methyltransferase [Candidatus Aenigmarchaeota archaeon]
MSILPRIKEFQDNTFLDAYLNQYIDPTSPGDLKSVILFQEISSYLDVACGSGYFAYNFADQFPNHTVRGIDFHPRCISEEKNRGHFSNLRFDEMNITNLNPAYDTFDAVRIHDSLHHFEDLDTAIKNVVSVINQGGILMISDFDREYGLKENEIKEWYPARIDWGTKYKQMFVDDSISLNHRQIIRDDALLYDSIIASFTLTEVCESLDKNGMSVQDALIVYDDGVPTYHIFALK